MNNQSIFKKTALATAMATSVALLSACGGSDTGTTASNGTTTVGVVTGFGSQINGGTKHNTDNAPYYIDGVLSDESKASVGYVCTLVGTVSSDRLTGVANTVTCTDELEGYVLGVTTDPEDGSVSLDVMGQTVIITMDTVFDSDIHASITDLAINDIVEVYGFSDGEGTVVATRVETKALIDSDIEIKGLVSNLGTTTFNIGSLIVDFEGVNVPTLKNGLYVEVKATDAPTDNGGVMTLFATAVEIEGEDMSVDGEPGQELNLTGLVGKMIAADETDPTVKPGFMFNGSTFIDYEFVDIEDTFAPTIYEGMTLTVEGKYDADGVFIPEEVVEEPETEAETYGYVTSVADGTISIRIDDASPIETFTVNNDTRMIDELNHVQKFNLGMVSDGDYVEIEYYPLNSVMMATELELKAAPAPESNTAM